MGLVASLDFFFLLQTYSMPIRREDAWHGLNLSNKKVVVCNFFFFFFFYSLLACGVSHGEEE